MIPVNVMNKDRRKKYYLVIDTETAGGLDFPLVYDIGFQVIDKTGKAYYSKHYAIYELFVKRPDLMKTAYYKEKIPRYWDKILDGNIKLARFFDVREEIFQLIEIFNIKDIGAYNCYFDKTALENTLYFLFGDIQNYFPKSAEFFCIWHMACQTICKQKSYLRFCLHNGLESEKGNIKTSAETVYQYLINNPHYCEEHMGLDDVKIEAAIFAKCIRQHKKMKRNIFRRCWQLPQNDYKMIKGTA